MILTTWKILGITAIVLLLLFFRTKGKNAVWGSAVIGAVIAVMTGVITWIFFGGFNWRLVKQIVVVAILLGGLIEIVGRWSPKRKASAVNDTPEPVPQLTDLQKMVMINRLSSEAKKRNEGQNPEKAQSGE